MRFEFLYFILIGIIVSVPLAESIYYEYYDIPKPPPPPNKWVENEKVCVALCEDAEGTVVVTRQEWSVFFERMCIIEREYHDCACGEMRDCALARHAIGYDEGI